MDEKKIKTLSIFEPTFHRLGKHKKFLESWDDLMNKLLDEYEKNMETKEYL